MKLLEGLLSEKKHLESNKPIEGPRPDEAETESCRAHREILSAW